MRVVKKRKRVKARIKTRTDEKGLAFNLLQRPLDFFAGFSESIFWLLWHGSGLSDPYFSFPQPFSWTLVMSLTRFLVLDLQRQLSEKKHHFVRLVSYLTVHVSY
ncbi:Hypothetical predicted protein [Olea europaea subsp. europaea]|uniref:Uncharacterized protein n=1 Tax=Olea europaea subsp. europaea TaxID=158383 RepID=A0A8S0S9E9_OLEEU|nr:Hypothetical predicted protein [Olea europaea subsp. europaea]